MNALHETVGRLVVEHPARARVFEEFDIDYCCGGKRTLGDACAQRGIDPAVVVRRLEAVDAGPLQSGENWAIAPAGELCDHIVASHHAFLRRELPRVRRLVEKIARVHGDRHPELVKLSQVYQSFASDLDCHMDKEEQVLFPIIKRLADADMKPSRNILAPVRVMEAEHDEAGHALALMRQLTNGFQPPEDACNTYRAAFAGLQDIEIDLHQHVHLENNVLFPQLEQMVAIGAPSGEFQ